MKRLLFALTAIAFSVATIGAASADTVVYSNDFNSDPLGGVMAPFGHGGAGGSGTNVVAADANFASQYLELCSRADNGNFGFGFFNGGSITDPGWDAVTTFKFDALFATADMPGTSRFRLRVRDSDPSTTPPTNNDAARVDLLSGEVVLDAVNTYQFVINNTTSVADRPDLAGTIAANSWEFYENGVLLEGGIQGTPPANPSTVIGTGSPVDELTLWLQGDTATSSKATVRLDNFSVITNAVPEPSSLAMLGLGAMGLVARRRRK